MEPIEVVVVCTANRARSPLAEALLERRVTGFPVRVRSRGVAAVEALPALPEMVRAAGQLGVDLSDHRAHRLVEGELADADLVLGFEPSHTAAAVVEGGTARDVVFTLAELAALLREPVAAHHDLRARVAATLLRANEHRRGKDPFRAPTIQDPIGGSEETFACVTGEIESAVDRVALGLFLGVRPPRNRAGAGRLSWWRTRGATGRRGGGSSDRLSA